MQDGVGSAGGSHGGVEVGRAIPSVASLDELDVLCSYAAEIVEEFGGVDIVVRDQGPGIPDYADARVFEKFYSLARPHSNKKSTGLGLPFVKEIAELHHGRVSLKNADGGGALATLALPLASSTICCARFSA